MHEEKSVPVSQGSESAQIDVESIQEVSGQVSIAGQDVTGGDKITAGGHVIHAESGATVYVGAAPAQLDQGFQALGEFIRLSPKVRSAMIAFRTDFEAASMQVGALGDYKDLHDLLHRLQFECFKPIVQASMRFPDDEMTVDNLWDYKLTLERIHADLREVVSRAMIPSSEVTWIDSVGEALDELEKAIDALDKELLIKVIWRMNRLLSYQPTRINTRLNSAARALRLPSLIDALTQVRDFMLDQHMEQDRVNAFMTGLEALVVLNNTLAHLVDEHDHWQVVDVELRRIEALIDKDLLELEMSWLDLRSIADPLYTDREEEWAVAIQKDCQNLEEMLLLNNNPIKIKRAFRNYRRRASDHFYRVDFELKNFCSELRLIAGPIATVLEMIK